MHRRRFDELNFMPTSISNHERFIRAVHRRLIVIRAAENLGICLLVGCAAALLLLPVVLWRDVSSAPLLLIGLGLLSAMAAIAMTFWRWPQPMDAAAEADRQLNLADLLTTTVELRRANHQEWSDQLSAIVLASANLRCQQFSPSAVVLNRLGARVWGGIGLSISLVITLAVIPVRPGISDAAKLSDGSSRTYTETGQNPLISREPIRSITPIADRDNTGSSENENRLASARVPSAMDSSAPSPSGPSKQSSGNDLTRAAGNGASARIPSCRPASAHSSGPAA